MANDLNLCQFIGRLGKDPEISAMANGTAVAKISIAVGESWKDKASGQKQERTTWVPVVAFGRLAEVMGQYLTKGSKVYLSGKFSTRKWQGQDGQDRYTTEIIANEMQMLDGRGDASGGVAPAQNRGGGGNAPQQPSGGGGGYGPASSDFDSDIPFSPLSGKLY